MYNRALYTCTSVYMYMHPLCSLSGYGPDLNNITITYSRYVLNVNVRNVTHKIRSYIDCASIIHNVTRLI